MTYNIIPEHIRFIRHVFKKAILTGLDNFGFMQILQALRRAYLSLFCCIRTASQVPGETHTLAPTVSQVQDDIF